MLEKVSGDPQSRENQFLQVAFDHHTCTVDRNANPHTWKTNKHV